ncbi:MAG: Arylsulfatase, partial [Pseudomonadota bacterium]
MTLTSSTLKSWLALCACAALLICTPVWAKRPNIVVMLADDWGFSDVGAFGSEIQTPNLNQLAQSGMRFSNFHVSASCSPTRSMLLTGVDNHLNGVGNMRETIPQSHVGRAGYLSVLNQRVVTVSSLLQDSGYRTYVAGKWHVGKEPHNLPPARGFDRSLVMGDSGSDNWETDKLYLDLTDKVYWYDNGQEAKMPKEFYSTEFYINKTLEYLQADAKSDKPFFAYIAFQANHIPLQAPQSFIDKYKGRYDKGWDVLRNERRDKAIALGLVPANS